MRDLWSSLMLSLGIASSASAVTMSWTPIGDPANACDPQQSCFGTVGYDYFIGTYEVTYAQYAEFLNAKGASDPYELYSTSMEFSLGGITRSGVDGSYSYRALPGRAEMPVGMVSFYDALRFANWMHNGQGSGDTETGAYTLLGGTPVPSNGRTVTRNAEAATFLTSEDEWYKAAFYDATTASYFDYPTGSNTPTVCSTPTATANRANCGNAVADLTIAGRYAGSASPYGTFDQGGNVWEWNETIRGDPRFVGNRGLRGGAFGSIQGDTLDASHAAAGISASQGFGIGFRLAMIPSPAPACS